MCFHEMGTVDKNALKNYEVRNLIAKGIKAVFSLLVSGRIHTGAVWLALNEWWECSFALWCEPQIWSVIKLEVSVHLLDLLTIQ